MKKLIASLLILVAVSSGSYAQQRGSGDYQRGSGERISPEKRAEMQTKRMTEELGLNEEQQKKLLALNAERTKKSQELGREEATKRREIREEYVKELNTILTPEQQEKLKNKQREGRGSRKGASDPRGRKRPEN